MQTGWCLYPFLYLIRDRESGAILFLGRLVDPTAGREQGSRNGLPMGRPPLIAALCGHRPLRRCPPGGGGTGRRKGPSMRRLARVAILAGGLLALAAGTAAAGHWITPAFPEGEEPEFLPVPLYWFTIRHAPLLYRTVVEVPEEVDRATVLAATSGYLYVYVDGTLAYRWAPQAGDSRRGRSEVPADRTRVHEVDLTPLLSPGTHALAVSAPREGFALDGGFYGGAKRQAGLGTDGTWTVTKVGPAAVLADHPAMQVDYDGPAAPVNELERWTADEDTLARVHARAVRGRCEARLADALWQLDLLLEKGIYVVEDRAMGWGGPQRIDWRLRRQARRVLCDARETREALQKLASDRPVADAEALAAALPEMAAVVEAVEAVAGGVDDVTNAAYEADHRTAYELISKLVPVKAAAVARADDWAVPYRQRLDDLLNRLNEGRYDRLGWIAHPELVDSHLDRWGVRINPVRGPTRIAGPRQWRFKPDPRDEGVEARWWSTDYNLDNQWAETRPRSWVGLEGVPAGLEVGWYRSRWAVPGEWGGCNVEFTFAVSGVERVWVNDEEVTALGSGQEARLYRVPARLVVAGAENLVALRIEAVEIEEETEEAKTPPEAEKKEEKKEEEPPEAKPGLTGRPTAACPDLDRPQALATPPVDVLATPLSPCVVLLPRTDAVEVRHGLGTGLCLPSDGRMVRREAYDAAKDGRLEAGWVLLGTPEETAKRSASPILLVFEKPPLAVVCREGVARIVLTPERQRAIAVRPFGKAVPEGARPEDLLATVRLWHRAALAVPVNYMSVTRVERRGEPYAGASVDRVPAGPVLGQGIVYDYLVTDDAWGTEPLKLAPLPALASLAIQAQYPGLEIDRAEDVEVLQDAGLLAPYRAIRDRDRIAYRYPIEAFPRFVGFTSWMFAEGDAGVRGNKLELELIASLGANSYRPQHNWSDHPPPAGHFPPGDRRSRVEVLAGFCNAVGVGYVNNIDQTLGGPREVVRDDYDAFMDRVGTHYETIARQLRDRPFWAVAYDLINEPFDHRHPRYNPAIRRLTERIRQIDRRHLLYVEPPESWGGARDLHLVEPTGDPLTVYSFHSYRFRLKEAGDRWPTAEADISDVYREWLPAIEYMVRHGVPIHCGEFGGFQAPSHASPAQRALLADLFRVFDQFGMHHHYYSGRGIWEWLPDGGLRPSNVVHAYRAYTARPDFNRFWEKWPEHPEPAP